MHEDGDNQARLQYHEQEDQRPSEIALDVKIVDEIGESTENKQPCPHHKIELDRMFLSFVFQNRGLRPDVCLCLRHRSLLPKIEKCKDKHPHQIDEVPI